MIARVHTDRGFWKLNFRIGACRGVLNQGLCPGVYARQSWNLAFKVRCVILWVLSGFLNDRLHRLKLWTLEGRRNRADLLKVLKMKSGLTRISMETFFDLNVHGATLSSLPKKEVNWISESSSFQKGLYNDGTICLRKISITRLRMVLRKHWRQGGEHRWTSLWTNCPLSPMVSSALGDIIQNLLGPHQVNYQVNIIVFVVMSLWAWLYCSIERQTGQVGGWYEEGADKGNFFLMLKWQDFAVRYILLFIIF